MIAIDTNILVRSNILVRYITQDDLQQAEAAENLLAIYNNKPQSIFINNIVLCEFMSFFKDEFSNNLFLIWCFRILKFAIKSRTT